MGFRRHHSDQVGQAGGRLQKSSARASQRATMTHPIPKSSPARQGENLDRRNYYLDLAGIENYHTTKLLDTSAPADMLHGDAVKPEQEVRETSKRRSRVVDAAGDEPSTSRSKSLPKTQDCALCTDKANPELETCDVQGIKTGSEKTPNKQACSNSKQLCSLDSGGHPRSPFSQPKSSSTPKNTPKQTHTLGMLEAVPEMELRSPHHHRRHRHRDKNQVRAMQQVAEWIEREQMFSSPDGSNNMVVQRHEHHHVHEHHHHHHYHHYHES